MKTLSRYVLSLSYPQPARMDGIDRVAADNVANLHIAAYLAVAVATVSRSTLRVSLH